MKLFFMLVPMLLGFLPVENEQLKSDRTGICDVYGTAFEVKNVFEATYRVYLEEDEYSADLIVFKETNELMADDTGLWFFTKNKAFAEFTICYVEDRNLADFTVHYTDVDVEAHCNR
ncbi:DUF6150 family protein [Chondrinema litorale]|uniref:DUF6150 family protein n=1 Tax=Chondrinema litorale TaxID=2994555 RepID=UPI0025429F74|nr:DUF6150 family protein [Chondrinema litorale]UZR95911.1 DUF6150 family protein [Chondrinema litorale]